MVGQAPGLGMRSLEGGFQDFLLLVKIGLQTNGPGGDKSLAAFGRWEGVMAIGLGGHRGPGSCRHSLEKGLRPFVRILPPGDGPLAG